MRTYGKTYSQYTAGIAPYSTSALAQAEITELIAQNYSGYTSAQIIDAFNAPIPNSTQQAIITKNNLAIASGSPLLNIGGGTSYSNSYQFTTNDGTDYVIEYSIRFDGTNYYIDKTLVSLGSDYVEINTPYSTISDAEYQITNILLPADLMANPGSSVVGNAIIYKQGGGRGYYIRPKLTPVSKFCAINTAGQSATSNDGLSWSYGTIVGSFNATQIAASAAGFIACNSTQAQAQFSADGINWVAITLPYYYTYRNYVLTATPTEFLILESDTYNEVSVFKSTNGTTWSDAYTGLVSVYPVVAGYGNGKYVFIDSNGYPRTSADGIAWTLGTQLPISPYVGGCNIASNGRKFAHVLVGNSGSTTQIAISSDGLSWVAHTIPTTYQNIKVWVVPTLLGFSIVGTDHSGINYSAYSNDDGITWTSSTLPSAATEWICAATNGSIIVCPSYQAFGGAVTAISSDSGATWSAHTALTDGSWNAMTVNNESYTTEYFIDYTNDLLPVWVEVDSDPINGDSYIWITTLIQNLKLSPNESPFFAANGIPAQQSVITQIYPDYYVAQLQQQFAQYFSSLQITKVQATSPTYKINAITLSGTVLNEVIAV